MTRFDIFDVIERLRREARPFTMVTVVRTADATSAKAGAKAAVTAEGEILGHLGGACVKRAVRQAAVEALKTGQARMIQVRPADNMDRPAPDIAVHSSGCPSGGTVDLFIEPYRMPPRLIILGDTPIASAIAAHGRLMGFQVTDDLAGDGASDFVVIASQGNSDEAALAKALASSAQHIAMIASQRKAQVLVERLAASGVPRVQLERLKAPAGLDLGGIDPHEIAISVLAEIVALRHRNQDGVRVRPDE
ncbi:MAG: XdhC family protein [Pseudomonadota bacterium]